MGSELFIYGFKHYFVVFIVCFILYIIGKRILIGYKFDSAVEDVVFSTGVGLGVAIFLTMFLGFFRLLYPSAIILAFIAFVASGYPVYKRWFAKISNLYWQRETLPGYWYLWIIGAIIIIILISPILRFPLYPPTGYDATSYHLPCAKYFSEWHAIRFTPFLRYPVFTINIEMLYTLMMVIYDDIGVQLIQFTCLVVTALSLVAWGKRISSYRAGAFAGAMLIATPQLYMLASVGYIELGLVMFITLAIYAFFNWANCGDDRWLYLSAVFFGLSAGTKYSSLFFIVIFGLAALVLGIKRKQLRPWLIFIGLIVVAGCPWYIRNAVYTGNPVFPFFDRLFGHSIWDEKDLPNFVKQMTLFGGGTSLLSFFTMPYKLVYHFGSFVENEPLLKIWLYALPVGIVIGCFRSYTRWILLVSFLFYIFWFFSAQSLRYLDPILQLVALSIGFSFDYLLKALPLAKPIAARPAIAAVIVIAIMVPGINHAVTRNKQMGAVPTRISARHSWLGGHYPSYSLYKRMNEELGSNFKVYAVNGNEMHYYCDATLMGDWFGVARFRDIVVHPPGGGTKFIPSEELYKKVRTELGADYFIIQVGDIKAPTPEDDFFKKHFKPVMSTKRMNKISAVLYEVAD